MTTINWTANNISMWYVGPEAIPNSVLWVGWQGVIHEYGIWFLIVTAILFGAFVFTKNFVLAIIITVALAVNIWWIQYSGWPTLPVIFLRAIFGLLIAFVWLYLLQSRRVQYAGGSDI